MKVSWDSQYGDVRMPGICAVTGQPATGTMPVVFRKQWARFIPRGFARLIVNRVNRPQLLQIPVCDSVRTTANRNRLLSVAAVAFFVVVCVIGLLIKGPAGSVIAVIGLVVGIGAGIYFNTRINVLKTDVDGTRLTMAAASDAFAQNFAAMNPPGRIQVEGQIAPQQFQQQQPYQPQQQPYQAQQQPYETQQPYQPQQPSYQPNPQQPYEQQPPQNPGPLQ